MTNYLRRLEVEVTTDASGDAVVNTDRITGKVIGIDVDYGDLAGTTTVDVDVVGTPSYKVLDLAASNTDATYHGLKRLAIDGADGSEIAGVYTDIYVVDDVLSIAIANGGNAKSGTVRVLVEQYVAGGV